MKTKPAYLSFVAAAMIADALSRLHDEYVHLYVRNFCGQNVAILLSAVVSSVEHPDALDFDQEHSSSQHMTCALAGEFNSILVSLLVKVNDVNAPH